MQHPDPQYRFWEGAFAGLGYYYGHDPGPVVRRAVRYHRPTLPRGGTALDAGSGEGQDLAFLAAEGYEATGIEFTPSGVRKSRQLLAGRGLDAEVVQADLRGIGSPGSPLGERRFHLVLAVNAIQFMGDDGGACLDALRGRVLPGGVIGLSLFARDAGQQQFAHGLWWVTLEEVLDRFPGWQPLEAARLWQWGAPGHDPQSFVTLIARAPR